MGSQSVLFEAQTIGSAGSASAGQIDTAVTTSLGVTVSNPGALSGIDEEADEDLRERCRNSLGPLSPNGPKRAIEYVLTTPSLSGVAINRVLVLQPLGDGFVYVYAASEDGALSAPDIATAQVALDTYATSEVQTTVLASATDKAINVAPTVYVKSGLRSDSEWEDVVDAALRAYTKTIPIGGLTTDVPNVVPWRGIVGIIKGAADGVISASLASEADISLAQTEVAVPGTYTITIVQVA